MEGRQRKREISMRRIFTKRSIKFCIEDQTLSATFEGGTKEYVNYWDDWVAQLVKHLPSAQVMIPESPDQVPHPAPCSAGSLFLPLPATPPTCARSRSLLLSLSDK